MRFLKPIFAGTLCLFCLSSCSDDKGPSGPDPQTPFPYTIPSVSTMQLNLEDLDQGNPRRPAGVCHAVSALAVAWVNVNVAIRLAVPIATFSACLQQQPVYLGDNTWRWTAGGGVGNGAWTAELTAHVASAAQIEWSMRVSGTPQGLDRFLWFDGTSDSVARAGVWHYYDPASRATPVEWIRCAWSLPEEPTASHEIAFENVYAGDPGYGDRLLYEVVDSVAAVILEDAGQATAARVHWDMRTGSGMAVSASGDSCCWGARPLYPDVDCPR